MSPELYCPPNCSRWHDEFSRTGGLKICADTLFFARTRAKSELDRVVERVTIDAFPQGRPLDGARLVGESYRRSEAPPTRRRVRRLPSETASFLVHPPPGVPCNRRSAPPPPRVRPMKALVSPLDF